MAHVVDTERAEKTRQEDEQQQYRWNTIQAGLNQAAHERFTHVCKTDQQTGNKLDSHEFVRRLRKLNKDIVMVPHPHRHTSPVLEHCGLLYLNVGDSQIYLFPCEYDWMPEWSLMEEITVRKPVQGSDGWVYVKVKVPGQEIRRGWRTVLKRLVEQRLVTLDAVEKEFGPGDRASWGKLKQSRVETLPM